MAGTLGVTPSPNCPRGPRMGRGSQMKAVRPKLHRFLLLPSCPWGAIFFKNPLTVTEWDFLRE